MNKLKKLFNNSKLSRIIQQKQKKNNLKGTKMKQIFKSIIEYIISMEQKKINNSQENNNCH